MGEVREPGAGAGRGTVGTRGRRGHGQQARGEEQCGGERGAAPVGGQVHGEAHPLTPLLISVAVKCFWNATNRATAGAASTTAPARMAPNGLVARPAMLLM